MTRDDDATNAPGTTDDGAHSRRAFIGGAAAVAAFAGTTLLGRTASAIAAPSSLAASPPAGFTPFSAPGRIVKVTKADSLQNNKLYPKADDAKAMLTRAMCELTGKPDLVSAVREVVHPNDVVCVKVNGIGGTTFASNKELVLPFLQAMIDAGVPAKHITVLDQYFNMLASTRITSANVPPGVQVSVHNNKDATMPERMITGTGVKTQFARVLTESTAVINFSLIKDHSNMGYTGLLKNITHGCQMLPHYFHAHHGSPQIALLYGQDVIKSRVRLGVTDGFKIMAHGGPKPTQPQHCYPHESVYVTTDPVAMDVIGAELVEKLRAEHNLRSLAAEGRPPAYIQAAGDLGLGVADRSQIQLKEITL